MRPAGIVHTPFDKSNSPRVANLTSPERAAVKIVNASARRHALSLAHGRHEARHLLVGHGR